MGGTATQNAENTKGILSGRIQGAKRDAVCMNAGAALYIGGKADSIGEGIKLAQQLIDSGAAMKKLEEFVEFSISAKDVLSMKDSEKEAVRQQGARKYGSNNT